MPNSITLITPTSGRPEAFALLEKYISQQTLQPDEWIVVDDSSEPTPVTLGQTIVRLSPAVNPRESFRRNYMTALSAVNTEKVIVCEDDDYYSREYVETMSALLDIVGKELVGQGRARYYHVGLRRYWVHGNTQHASLAQTAFRKTILPTMQKYLQTSPRPEQLDGAAWKRSGIPEDKKLVIPVSTMHVSLKGVAGTPGLGIHHTRKEVEGYTLDPELTKLREWIGQHADSYAQFVWPEETSAG